MKKAFIGASNVVALLGDDVGRVVLHPFVLFVSFVVKSPGHGSSV